MSWSASWQAPRKPKSGRPSESQAPHTWPSVRTSWLGSSPRSCPKNRDRQITSSWTAIGRTPSGVVLPSIRANEPPLRTDDDRPSQRARLGVREGTGPRGVCHLTSLRLRAHGAGAQVFICSGMEAPAMKRGKRSRARKRTSEPIPSVQDRETDPRSWSGARGLTTFR
jgi:hypothetical protein